MFDDGLDLFKLVYRLGIIKKSVVNIYDPDEISQMVKIFYNFCKEQEVKSQNRVRG